jgi:transposase
METETPELMAGEIEVEESYFGGHRKGRRGRCAALCEARRRGYFLPL